jgi:hypothetical protein
MAHYRWLLGPATEKSDSPVDQIREKVLQTAREKAGYGAIRKEEEGRDKRREDHERRRKEAKRARKREAGKRLASVVLPPPPFRMQIVGRTNSGKTHWLVHEFLLKYGRYLFDQVVYVAPTDSLGQASIKEIQKLWGEYFTPVVGLDIGAIDAAISHGAKYKWNTLVVLDDMMKHSGEPFIMNLFISGRHRGVSTVELLQQIFPTNQKGGDNRGQRLQCDIFVLFGFAVKNEAKHLFQQITLKKEDAALLEEAYQQVMREPHHCLIVDTVSPSTEDLPLRVRDTELTNLVQPLWNV